MKKLLIIIALLLVCVASGSLIAILLAKPGSPESPQENLGFSFKNEASSRGLTLSTKSGRCGANASGVAVFDANNDNNQDLLFTSYLKEPQLLLGNKQGRFTATPFPFPVEKSTGVAAADFNNDGRDDLFIASQAQSRLLVNEPSGFRDVTEESGLGSISRLTMAGSWADYNSDGLLDLAVTAGNNCSAYDPFSPSFRQSKAQLFEQSPKGRFSQVNILRGPMPLALGTAVAWTHLDKDRWIDLYQANDWVGGQENRAWRNLSGELFRQSFKGANNEIYSMGVGLGDFDNDGRSDLAITDLGPPIMVWNDGAKFNEDQLGPNQNGFVPTTWGIVGDDFNNDGREDLFAAASNIEDKGKQRPVFYLNLGERRFREAGADVGLSTKSSGRGLASLDLNRDGALDLVLTPLNGRPQLWINNAGGSWLQVKLVGRGPVARDACASQLTLLTKPQQTRELGCASESYLSTSEKILHFGLGQTTTKEIKAIIRWPNGKKQQLSLPVDKQTVVTYR